MNLVGSCLAHFVRQGNSSPLQNDSAVAAAAVLCCNLPGSPPPASASLCCSPAPSDAFHLLPNLLRVILLHNDVMLKVTAERTAALCCGAAVASMLCIKGDRAEGCMSMRNYWLVVKDGDC